jgi:tetratricopeptide (TPR) repeat protein
LRLGGALLMGIGFLLILGPLATVAEVIPLLGSIVGLGAGIAAAILAAGLSLTLIAMAWIWYRPLLGAALLAGVSALAGVFWWKGRHTPQAPPDVQPPVTPDAPEPAPPPPPPGVPEFLTAVDGSPATPTRSRPRTAVDHLKEGISHLRAGDLDTALTALSTAIQKDGELGAAYYFRGVVQSRRREKSAAVKNLQIAARLGHGKAREALTARRIAWQ